jgi:uncharacterized protein with von Willebrand factor type A (vWA) domain
LRAGGIHVTSDQLARFGAALAALDLSSRELVFWAGFSCTCTQREQLAAYARAFDAFWPADARARDERDRLRLMLTLDRAALTGGTAKSDSAGTAVQWQRYSAVAIERDKDFAAYNDEEFARFGAAVRALRLNPALRRSRRARRARRGRLDLRRMLREAPRAGGEVLRPRFRDAAERPRRIVALCDVSGSMEKHTRALLTFFHAGVVSGVPFEAFSLGTRTVRLTRALATRDATAALAGVARLAQDWAGGTRLGETLRAFLDGWGQRGLARGAIVAIVSDGWERGDVALLAQQMERLHRLAYRVIWINPRKAAAGYEPLAAGMAAALPFVDEFVSGHSLEALDDLARALAGVQRAPAQPG